MIAVWLFGLVSAYLLLAAVLTRQSRLPEPEVEWLEVELSDVGHHIALFHYPPETRRFTEPLILCHGLGANRFNMDFCDDGRGDDRLSLARALQRAGFDVWVIELRGRGRARVPARSRWTIDDELSQDVTVAIETVLDLSGADRLFWVGHSWGGILGYLLHARGHAIAEKVGGLVTLASPGTLRFQQRGQVLMSGPGRLLARLGIKVPLSLLSKVGLPIAWIIHLVGRLFMADLRAMDPAVVRRVFASMIDDINPGIVDEGLDWIRAGELLDRSGSYDELRFDRLDKPLLLMVGSHDRICPVAAVDNVAMRVTHEDVTVRIMGTATGFSTDYGHGSILLGRHAPDEVFPLIRGWLAARATRISRIAPRPSGGNGAGVHDPWN